MPIKMSENRYTRSQWDRDRQLQREERPRAIPENNNGRIIKHRYNDGIRNLPNFCRAGPMHTCDACKSPDRQKNCHFHLPSTGGNHCMELRFDKYCANQILHQYLAGGISDSRATVLVKRGKKKLTEIQNRVEGYHVDFPLEGEETRESLNHIYDQLYDLGMSTPEFWVDRNGRGADELDSFSITVDEVKNGDWRPKRKELEKDILRYFEIKDKLGV